MEEFGDYKIKVNNEAESREVQELFFELGYYWAYRNIGKKFHYEVGDVFIFADSNGILSNGVIENTDFFNSYKAKQLTLPQLRDLVVLHRNDVKDATHFGKSGSEYYVMDGGYVYFFDGMEWVLKDTNVSKLTPINQQLEQGLISGVEALKILSDGKDVEVHEATYKKDVWFDLKNTKYTISEILEERVEGKSWKLTFRHKPETIKLEIDIPAPFEPKECDVVWVVSDCQHGYRDIQYSKHIHNALLGVWKSEEDIKQVVTALRNAINKT